MRSVLALALALLLLGVLVTGCRLNPWSGQRLDKYGPPMAQVSGPQVGQPAPEIVGEDIDGAPLQLSAFRGQVVLLSFWADW